MRNDMNKRPKITIKVITTVNEITTRKHNKNKNEKYKYTTRRTERQTIKQIKYKNLRIHLILKSNIGVIFHVVRVIKMIIKS